MTQVLSWRERINALAEKGNVTGAIALGLQCWEGRAVAVVGLPRNQDDARSILAEEVNSLLTAQFNQVAQSHGFRNGSESVTHMKHVAGMVIGSCIRTRQSDAIYTRWFGLFQSVAHVRSFVESLEPFVLEGRLGLVSPVVLGSMYEVYRDNRMGGRMEELILKLHPTEANARQMIQICAAEKAYKAICHVYTTGLGDYITPLGVLLEASKQKEKETPLEATTRQNCSRHCLQYLSKVLGGEKALGGEITPRDLTTLRGMVYEHLFIPGEDSRFVFEHLLQYDPKGFFKALAHTQSRVLLMWAAPLAQALANLGLTTLDISNIGLVDSDAQGVAEVMKKAGCVTKLDVRGNQIGDDGCNHLVQALAHMPHLKEIDVEDNLIGEAALKHLRAALDMQGVLPGAFQE